MTTARTAIVGKRKIIVYIATSADGFIARPDGSVDWLDRPGMAGTDGYGGDKTKRNLCSFCLKYYNG